MKPEKISVLGVALVLAMLSMSNFPLSASATSQSNSNSTDKTIQLGYITVNGTEHPVVGVLENQSDLNTQNPPISAANTQAYRHKGGDFQYGPQWSAADGEYGAGINITYFDGQSNPSGFSQWVGFTDDKGFFYQAGIQYWTGCSKSYTIWAVDNYPNGGNNGLGIGCPATSTDQYNYSAIDSGWLNVLAFVYSGQWYVCFKDSHGNDQCPAFPNGADSGTKSVGYGGYNGAVSLIEGGDNVTGSTSYYHEGESEVNYLSYVSNVSYNSGTGVYTLTIVLGSSLAFFRSTGAGDTPVDTSRFTVFTSCPYEFESYFSHSGSALPSNRASVSNSGCT